VKGHLLGVAKNAENETLKKVLEKRTPFPAIKEMAKFLT